MKKTTINTCYGQKNVYCVDITREFKSSINVKKDATLADAKSISINGKRFYVNKKNKIIHEFNEEHVAEWIRKKLHMDVEYLPNITSVSNVKLGDYRINKRQIWELKTLTGNASRTIDSAIKNKKNQSSIFIIDMTYSHLNNNDVICQIYEVFRRRNWVKIVIFKRRNSLIKIFKRI